MTTRMTLKDETALYRYRSWMAVTRVALEIAQGDERIAEVILRCALSRRSAEHAIATMVLAATVPVDDNEPDGVPDKRGAWVVVGGQGGACRPVS